MFLKGQYFFKGQVSENYKGQPVYLSLVEDYRKTSRVYLNQIIQKVHSDSSGHFSFSGDHLSEENRLYRVHTDSCSDSEANKNHFLGACGSIEQVLFIANNRDTISLPLAQEAQAFCEIVSTNPASKKILEAELLKESMILDFVDSESETAKSLNLDKWFKKFQTFSETSNEPLLDLYCHGFMSDRSNETYGRYLEDVQSNHYYTTLLKRLEKKYPAASFTKQYARELKADRSSYNEDPKTLASSKWFFIFLAIILLSGLFLLLIRLKKNTGLSNGSIDTLTPQESKIYQAISEGKSNKEIANELFISHSTVKTHINNIYKKLGVSSREELL